MDNTRSYISRFSGLGLFLLALLVVGVLVWLTVRSANDSDTGANEEQATEQQQQQGEPTETPLNGEENQNNDENEGNENNGDESRTENGAVAAEQDGDTNGNLPNTGPESTVLSAFGISAIVWAVLRYRHSAGELEQSQR